MTTYLGDIALSQVLYLKVCTVSGAPLDITGPAVAIYKDDNTTESTAGLTLTQPFDSRTGLANLKIDTSADGTFYAAGHDFQAVVTSGTVSGVSVVGYVLGQFSINNRTALRPTTAGRTLDVSATGEAGLDWANIGTPTSTVNLSGTTIGVVTANSDKTGYTLSSAGITSVWTTAQTESYAAVNVNPTPLQILYEGRAVLTENNVSGTTVTTRKINGSTTAATYTIDSATQPTNITRAS